MQGEARETRRVRYNPWMAATLSAIPAGVMVLSRAGLVLFANARACEILGRDLADVLGQPVEDLLVPLEELLQLRGAERGELKVEIRGQRRVLGYSFSEVSAPPAPEAGCHVCLFQDITPMYQLRVERDRLLQLAAVGAALPSMLHELRNPLAAVTTKLEVMLEEVEEETLAEDLHSVLAEVRRATMLLQGVGAVGRSLRSVLLQAVDFELGEAIRLLKPAAARAGVRVVAAVPAMPLVPLDGSVVRAILFNLLSNAIAACEPGDEIWVRASLLDGVFELEVEDSGRGMDAHTLEHCTELFFSTKRHGSGIGLALCRQAAEDAGGELCVWSVQGEGTRITVRVDVTQEPGPPREPRRV